MDDRTYIQFLKQMLKEARRCCALSIAMNLFLLLVLLVEWYGKGDLK